MLPAITLRDRIQSALTPAAIVLVKTTAAVVLWACFVEHRRRSLAA
jgi:hypothetical protein